MVRPGANTASGGHLAYIPGGGLYHSALGDYLAAVSNKYAGVFFGGPGPVRMENMLIRWVADLVGYPAIGRRLHRIGRQHRDALGHRHRAGRARPHRPRTSRRPWCI